MEIISSCPKCGVEYTIADEFFDRPLQCQNCGDVFTVARPVEGGSEPVPLENCRRKVKQLAVKYKKWLIVFSCVLFGVIAALISLSILHKNYYRLPKSLLHVASYVGTPLQRARAFQRLAMQAGRDSATPEEKNRKREYYFQKGFEVLKGCEETPAVLRMKIALKYKHDISGNISEEAERLIKIDKSAIFNYVTTKYELYPRQFGEREVALLKEYEKYMLEKFDAKPDWMTAVSLARLYYFNAPDFFRDLEKMEFYLLKAKEFNKIQTYNWYRRLLIECYIMQGKFDQLDRFAEEFIRECSDDDAICNLACSMFRVYSGKYDSVERFVRARGEMLAPKNDDKAARWKALVKKLNPGIIL